MLLNELMKGYLRDVIQNGTDEYIDPVWTIFTTWDDCILLQKNLVNANLPNSFSETYFQDRTSLEADINHVHLNSFFKKDVKPEIVLQFALTLIDKWVMKLKSDYSNRNFHLLLSYDGVEVVLRFYSVRENEPLWVDVENLENYKQEGILVRII